MDVFADVPVPKATACFHWERRCHKREDVDVGPRWYHNSLGVIDEKRGVFSTDHTSGGIKIRVTLLHGGGGGIIRRRSDAEAMISFRITRRQSALAQSPAIQHAAHAHETTAPASPPAWNKRKSAKRKKDAGKERYTGKEVHEGETEKQVQNRGAEKTTQAPPPPPLRFFFSPSPLFVPSSVGRERDLSIFN